MCRCWLNFVRINSITIRINHLFQQTALVLRMHQQPYYCYERIQVTNSPLVHPPATLHGKEADILHLNPNICKHYWVHTVHKKRLQNFVDIPTTQIVYKHIGHQWQTLGSTVTSHTRKPEYKKYPSLLWTVKSWRRLCTFYWLQKKLKLLLRSRSQVTIVAGTTLIAWWWYQRMSDLLSKELPQHTTTKHTTMSDFLAITISPPK